jgi:hypothetical protein
MAFQTMERIRLFVDVYGTIANSAYIRAQIFIWNPIKFEVLRVTLSCMLMETYQ